MKLLSILKELNNTDVQYLKNTLGSMLAGFKFNFILTNHAAFDRLIHDKTRQNITKNDIIYTIETFVHKITSEGENNYTKKLDTYRNERKEIEGLITNLNNNLRIIFAIDYRRPNSRGVYDFKLITAIVSEDFRTDDRPFTQKFFIR